MDIVEKVQLYRRFVGDTVQKAMKALDKFDGDVDRALKAKGIDPDDARAIMDEEEEAEEKPDLEKETKFEYTIIRGPAPEHKNDEEWLADLLKERGEAGWLLCACYTRVGKPVAIFVKEKKPK